MIDHIKRQVQNLEETSFTNTGWILSFGGIFLVRYLLESLSTRVQSDISSIDLSGGVHIFLFFLTLVLGTIIIINFLSREKNAYKVVLFGLPVIWAAPLIDIILSRGNGYTMTYIRDTGSKLFFDYFTFFGTNFENGATYGMRIEMATILLFVALYVYIKTKNYTRSFLAFVFTYTFGFIMATLPGIMYTFLNFGQSGSEKDVILFLAKIIFNSNITYNAPGILTNPNSLKAFELGLDRLMSQMLFILCILFSSIILYTINNRGFTSVLKNIRPERLNFYTLSLLSGAGYAFVSGVVQLPVVTDLLGIICLVLAWVGLWMQAVHQNDIEDINIDKISNKNRPLVKNELSVPEMADTRNIWLLIALLGAYLAGTYPFVMSIIYIASSYIYSVPPLRLRRFPVIPSFLIGVACLSTILAGFFFVSVDKNIKSFPVDLALGIIIIVTLAINFKDLKDVDGDRANGVLTLPVIFGKYGEHIVASCLALSILLVPLILKFYFLFVFAIPISFLSYWVCIKKPYTEKNVFRLRFVFLFCIAISYLVNYLK